MSTQLLLLSGHKEIGQNFLYVRSFSGGEDRGNCIQLTLNTDYIQLEKSDVYELVEVLQKWLDD